MKKISILYLAIILFIISFGWIIINGKTYTVELNNLDYVSSKDDLQIQIEKENEVVKLSDVQVDEKLIKLKFESVKEGRVFVELKDANGDNFFLFLLYVHKSGLITYDNYFGDCTGCTIIPFMTEIFLIYVLIVLMVNLKKSILKNPYQYENVAQLGIIVFIVFAIINQALTIISYKYYGPLQTLQDAVSICTFFSITILPLALITAVLCTISNVVLIVKEGFSIRNLLGLIMGIVFCTATVLPNILYGALNNAIWFDIHNEQAIGTYIIQFIEIAIYACVSYIECILIGTIILGVKAAKHVPKFDKDFILILGCRTKKDGTLTNILKARVDRAIEFFRMQKEKANKDLIFVPSGGKGVDETISEADAMKNYLLEQGIKAENILVENKSKNTIENMKLSNNLINEKMPDAKVAFSTTNYHVFRAGIIASEQNMLVEGIGAKTKTYFWINAFIREFIATLYSEKRVHLFTLLLIILSMMNLMAIMYLSNIL